jgi:CheY-like chemotaxis protein
LHFNKKLEEDPDLNNKVHHSLGPPIHYNRLIAIDNVRVDAHSRLTLTRRLKDVFPISARDMIAVYQDITSKELIFKVQHGDNIVDSWLVKRIDSISSNSFIDTSKSSPIGSQSKINEIYQQQKSNNNNDAISNIMLVDDDQDLLTTFKLFLSSEGYNIETFADSREALKRFMDLNNPSYFNVVILDIRMPFLNGIQLYQILKVINTNIKVLFASALDAAEELTSVFPTIKSNDIIRKPIGEEHFIKKIKETILA